jgi:hypothetical protein
MIVSAILAINSAGVDQVKEQATLPLCATAIQEGTAGLWTWPSVDEYHLFNFANHSRSSNYFTEVSDKTKNRNEVGLR